MPEIKIFHTKEQLLKAAAAIWIEAGQQAIRERDRFCVALSGGSTPQPLYELLAQDGRDDGLQWDRVDFFWGDERAVARDHSDSNFGQAYRSLLAPRNIPPQNIYPIQGDLAPETAARIYQQDILDYFHPNQPVFDLVLLGMGNDGHTASLFPGTEAVQNAGTETEPWVEAVYVSQLETWRISMTARLIKAARQIVFLVSGEGKAGMLNQVLNGPYQPVDYPAQLIASSAIWLVDRHAAAELESD